MFTVQSISVATSDTGRVMFGPFKAGETVIGLHVLGSYPTVSTFYRLWAAVVVGSPGALPGQTEFEALPDQLFGQDSLNFHRIALPPGVSTFVPLDLRFDRTSWLICQIENPSAAETLQGTVGFERALEESSQAV